MKYLPSTLLIGAMALALQAQTPAPKPTETPQPKPTGDPFVKDAAGGNAKANGQRAENPEVVVVFDAYSLNRNDAASLLATETGSGARYRRVLEMEKAGKAHLQILTALDTKSGQRALTESIDEVRYATGFSWGNPLPTPELWESRNVGDTFELEPVVGPDNRTCDLNFVPTRVTLAGFRDEAGAAGDPPTSHPVFHSQKITTSVSAISGEPFYVGSMTPPPVVAAAQGADSAEVWLAFIHSTVKKFPPMVSNEPIPEGPLMTSLIYSCYSLDREAARDILISPSSIEAPWEKVQALLAGKKAQLEFVTSARTKSGQREVVEEVQEVRYMAEYNPPSLTNSSETGVITDNKGETSNLTLSHTPSNARRDPGFGTKFDTRNAGITVEFEPVLREDGKRMDINEVIQNVHFRGMLKVPGIGANYQPQPLFQTSKIMTSQTVISGRTEFVSTLNPPGADGVNDQVDTGRTWLLFVHATADLP
ncbi:hypothetical protein CfE428DRAFT_0120 [Chthoniobacter flavus Ellin428]|uniref:Uncharacterized protein n=1 Tax=Chthoniobacter flavus Ellin428 TaxID=497964 RepID=B4CTV7_9BACT|nr:hypothetical protein [Chthoniobacter flavus]EDY21995.1 hypothetical protein CfE428DRAFT_0120 [Chthoniobacter flavus Ellin428]TCO89382.1 hypothetical protein EV701_114116 [Chthoniobacter flavus]